MKKSSWFPKTWRVFIGINYSEFSLQNWRSQKSPKLHSHLNFKVDPEDVEGKSLQVGLCWFWIASAKVIPKRCLCTKDVWNFCFGSSSLSLSKSPISCIYFTAILSLNRFFSISMYFLCQSLENCFSGFDALIFFDSSLTNCVWKVRKLWHLSCNILKLLCLGLVPRLLRMRSCKKKIPIILGSYML